MKPHHWRRTWLGKYLRHIPRQKQLNGTWLHRLLGDKLLHSDLWSPDRKKIAAGFSLGAFFSMLPMPLQMVPAILFAYIARVNLPAAWIAIWISNPITTPPLLYLQYKIGHKLLAFIGHRDGEELKNWVDLLKEAPLSILCGALITGIIASAIAYPLALYTWDMMTSWVKKAHDKRLLRKKAAALKQTPPPPN